MVKTSREINHEIIKGIKKGDKCACDALIQTNMGLVMSCAKKFLSLGYELDDLVQLGSIGLFNAAKRFDFSLGNQFSTYAVPMILGEIKKFIRDDGTIKISRHIKELSIKINRSKERLEKELLREPTCSEIAEFLGVSVEEVVTATEHTAPIISLHSTYGKGDKSGETLLIDMITGGKRFEDYVVCKDELLSAIKCLNDREKNIVMLRFFKEKTQVETAKLLGISQVQVSRIEKKMLLKLRDRMTYEGVG